MSAPWKKALAVMMITCFLFSSITAMAAEAVDDYAAADSFEVIASTAENVGGGY